MAWDGAAGDGLGAAAALVEAASYESPAGQYAAQPNGAALAAGPFWQKTGRTDQRSRLNAILFTGQASANPMLAIRVGAPDITKGDTGALTSAVAAANQHGLPANFGPGRANWLAEDIAKIFLDYRPVQQAEAAGASQQTYTVPAGITLATGNVTILSHNTGAQALLALSSVQLYYSALA